jgi:hypothetical protein
MRTSPAVLLITYSLHDWKHAISPGPDLFPTNRTLETDRSSGISPKNFATVDELEPTPRTSRAQVFAR